MHTFIQIIFALTGVVAAALVGVMCAVCFVVWFGGGSPKAPSETWRAADER